MQIPAYKELRKARNLTIRDVENATGLSNAYISQLENGKIKNPGFKTITRLNEYFALIPTEDSKIKCPLCKSENVKDYSIYPEHIVFGGGPVLPIREMTACQNCGIIFKKLD